MILNDSITIDAPVKKVFAVWSDIERYSDWADPVLLREKLTDGPTRIGTRFKCVDRWPGREVTFEMEITEYEDNKRLGASWSKPMKGQWTSSLTPSEGGTRLDFKMEVRLPFPMRLLAPVMKRYARKQNRLFMLELKSQLES